jgi:hypothetical protein
VRGDDGGRDGHAHVRDGDVRVPYCFSFLIFYNLIEICFFSLQNYEQKKKWEPH